MSFFVIIIIAFVIISSKKKAGQPNQRNQQFRPQMQNHGNQQQRPQMQNLGNQQQRPQMQNQGNQQQRPQMQNHGNQQQRPQMQNPGISPNASFAARQAKATTAARSFAAQSGNMTAKNAKDRPAAPYKDKVQNSSAGNGVSEAASITASGSKRIEPASGIPSDPVSGITEFSPNPSLSMEGTLYIPNEPSTLLLGMVEYDQRFGGF